MTADVLEQRIETLELKIMEMENTVQELNEVVLTQYRDIERMQNQYEQLMNRMINNSENSAAPSAGDELPPHY
jgi:SlyX protein